MNGVIIDQTRGAYYKVELENSNIIIASVASKFKVPRKIGKGTTRAKVFIADKVVVEIPLGQTEIKVGTIVGFQK